MKFGTQKSVLRPLETLFSAGSVGGMTDGQLLEEFLSRRDDGAEAAFAALVALHGPMVWKVCESVLADSHCAEDAFQATFLILVRKASSIRHRDTLGAWLYGVARRVAIRAKTHTTRRRRHEAEGAEMQKAPAPTPDASMREQLAVMHQEVDRLPQKYRAAVVLCHLEGRTHAEAAQLLKCPVGTISVRVARARELLRARLTRRGMALPAALAGVTHLSEVASAAAIPKGLAASTVKVAMHVATGKAMAAGVVPATVAQLTEGVIKTMFMTKLTLTAAGVLLAGITVAGAGLLAAGGGPAQINPTAVPVVVSPAPTLPAAAAPAQVDPDDPEAKDKSANYLREIALAMHNFASRSDVSFPPAAIRKDGKPLLSWRVAILPDLGQKALYDKFHLDEPWDSAHNMMLLGQMPDVYAPVVDKDKPKGSTYYQVFAGPGALFEGGNGPKLLDIKDGISNTAMIVESAKPVPWTKPEDVVFDKEKPLPELGGYSSADSMSRSLMVPPYSSAGRSTPYCSLRLSRATEAKPLTATRYRRNECKSTRRRCPISRPALLFGLYWATREHHDESAGSKKTVLPPIVSTRRLDDPCAHRCP
jgi:RNA polymerase sigma factor (sigma-70 family)